MRGRLIGRSGAPTISRRAAVGAVAVVTAGLLVQSSAEAMTAPDDAPAAAVTAKPPAITGTPYLYTSSLAWRAYTSATDTSTRRDFYNIAATPTAIWLGGSSTDGASVQRITTAATAQNRVAQFVMYAIPGRDCGGFAAGGSGSEAAYRLWVQQFVAGIGQRKAVVTIEPDAISFCNNDPATRAFRTRVLTYAAKRLHDYAPNAAAYLHAGSGSLPMDYAVSALKDSGIGYLRGFAMNVASHGSTAEEQAYGDKLVAALKAAGVPGEFYVVDTGRNGIGRQPNPGAPYNSCNNSKVALGTRPTTATTSPYADAYLWIKPPGESDGACHAGDVSTGWFGALARKLVANARAYNTIAYWPLP